MVVLRNYDSVPSLDFCIDNWCNAFGYRRDSCCDSCCDYRCDSCYGCSCDFWIVFVAFRFYRFKIFL
jgi:hypothetical protein